MIDDIYYHYQTSSGKLVNNKLLDIQDVNPAPMTGLGDIVSIGSGVDKSSTYSYDALGNLVAENDKFYDPTTGTIIQGYTNIEWTLTGKINRVFYSTSDNTNRSELDFTYDVGDYRLSKAVSDGSNTTKYFLYA